MKCVVLMRTKSRVKEDVVVVGEKVKDESMKMNRENYDDVMGSLDWMLPFFFHRFGFCYIPMK